MSMNTCENDQLHIFFMFWNVSKKYRSSESDGGSGSDGLNGTKLSEPAGAKASPC